MVSLSLSESPASYRGDKPPWGCLQRAVFQCVFSSSVLQPLSTSCLFKHLSYHSANPRFAETARAHPQRDGTAEGDGAGSLCQTLHFLCKCPEEKKKRDHFQWVKLLSWDLCLGRRSVKDKLRCFKLFTVCFLPSLPPLSIEAFFLLLLPFFFPP